jgi:hypothetical protein
MKKKIRFLGQDHVQQKEQYFLKNYSKLAEIKYSILITNQIPKNPQIHPIHPIDIYPIYYHLIKIKNIFLFLFILLHYYIKESTNSKSLFDTLNR